MVSQARPICGKRPIMQLDCMCPKCSTSSAGRGTRRRVLICRREAASGEVEVNVPEEEVEEVPGNKAG